VLALLVLAKGVAYTLSLGAGFRGGPVFPALTLGLAAGTLAAILFPGLELTPAVVAE
jgi:H+/Cl- antiporter ClcA